MNRIFTVAILCGLHTCLQAQAPFGTPGTQWIFEAWSEGSGWFPNWTGNCAGNQLTYEVSGQTEINGKKCGIITTNKNTDSIFVYQEDGIVYFYEDSAFHKLFDFNAVLGDTIVSFRPGIAWNHSLKDFFGGQQEFFDSVDTVYNQVIGYDTIEINGVPLKRWVTDPVFFGQYEDNAIRLYETIVENIGSLNGLLGDHGWFIGEGCYGGFVCYQSEQFQYGSYFFPMCDFTSSTGEISNSEILMYPNPSAGLVTVGTQSSDIERIEVFDFSGVKLLTTTTNVLELSNYPRGVYLVRVRTTLGTVQVGKLVIN